MEGFEEDDRRHDLVFWRDLVLVGLEMHVLTNINDVHWFSLTIQLISLLMLSRQPRWILGSWIGFSHLDVRATKLSDRRGHRLSMPTKASSNYQG